MHVLITGAGGMIGRKLTARIAEAGHIGRMAVERLTLADIAAPPAPAGFSGAVEAVAVDIADPGAGSRLIDARPDLVVHLAAVVSGEAEADLDKGYRINLDGTRALFEAIRHEAAKAPYCPRVVFTSSIAVFGAPFPACIDDDFLAAPLTSYGAQKAMGELLLADYSRRGFLDGIGLRLPTICIRPGAPNRAASGFFSGILREPLAGRDAVLPVPDDVCHWFASPRAAVGMLLHAAGMDLGPLGSRRTLNMPGVSATVAEELATLRRVGGEAAVARVRREPDETIARIVAGWPADFDTRRALASGFVADESFEAIVRTHVEDELGGRIGG